MTDNTYYGGGGGGGQQQQSFQSNSYNQRSQQPTTDQGKIFVGGLSWQTTEESLRWHFEQYGQVVSVELMKDRNTGKPRGFGFVCFSDPSTVDLVMQEDRHEINHKIVDVKRAQARGVAPPSIHEKSHQRNKYAGAGGGDAGNSAGDAQNSSNPQGLTPEQLNNKVFVGGIPPSIDRDTLRSIFEQFGPVQDAVVMLDQVSNRSRGFGFVTFEHGSNGAERAIEAQPLEIHGRNVEVKLATPRADQPAKSNRAGGAASGQAPPPKHLGLRAGQASSSGGIFAGLAVAYGRSGWKAGCGSKAFGKAGWGVWEDDGPAPERSGFSFDKILGSSHAPPPGEPPLKRARH